LGKENLLHWTGNPLATGFMLATWLWLVRHEASTAQASHWLLLPKDYLRYRMTGQVGSEPSDASSTLLFDPFNRCWSSELLTALKIDLQLLPQLGESAQIAGELLPDFAEISGLQPGTPVVYGGSDQALQALAQGVLAPGQVSCTIGTGGQILAPLCLPRADPDLRLHLFCHALPGLWHLEAAILTAGYSLRWLRDQVLPGADYTALADLASQAPPGSEGLFFLPYLAGERTPWMDPAARGALIGLTLRHDRRHLVRALMEGVVLALRQALVLTLALAGQPDRIITSGGATRHPLWLQLQADIFNLPVTVSPVQEATGRGAALLAGLGVGIYRNLADALEQIHPPASELIYPSPARAALYDRHYEQFIRLYPALKDIAV
jgi:xylulokinase